MRFPMLLQQWFKSITWLVHGYKGERRKYLFKMASRQGKGEESMLNLVELVHGNVITDLSHAKKSMWEFDVWEFVSKAINSGVQIVIIAINSWRPKSSCCSVCRYNTVNSPREDMDFQVLVIFSVLEDGQAQSK